ncbi:hypothetical protein SAMN05444273_1181 [Litoreibacter ascidiaceicola]|uniref:Uncharacterized protein n=1 Tax=Litoreibacter ascidiaceicola TaxID=1486859 RepID=A0A1M5EZ30_9RHOB|nr:hypothetical protein [Litoreibacter ascidiaceicola]SHF84533.1 hypothetical protein SAMN05444273_1181 [Litoreibacter ascidiaceicola]
MDYAKVLTQGIGAWLHYEHACGRSELFSEKYLATPVGQILTARSSSRTHAEFKHPVLANLSTGPGRPPEIDFVVCENYPEVSLAVETKWVGDSIPSIQSIIWDLIRLEMVNFQFGARCFFILAGKKDRMAKLFNAAGFINAAASGHKKPLLNVNKNAIHRTYLAPIDIFRRPTLKKVFKNYQDHEFPEFLSTRRSSPFPEVGSKRGYQVYTWEVLANGRKNTFWPKNSKHLML